MFRSRNAISITISLKQTERSVNIAKATERGTDRVKVIVCMQSS